MENRSDRLADRISGVFWIAFGILVIASSVGMDIRKHLGATFLTGPGFVPILLGGALCILGLILIIRSLAGRQISFLDVSAASEYRAMIALALMLIYSIGLVGRMPFGIATFLFISTFIIVFNLPAASKAEFARLFAKATVTAAVTSAAIVYAFHNLFLVRLP